MALGYISKAASTGFADGLDMWRDEIRGVKGDQGVRVLGQAVWYELQRVQVHRDSGIPVSYSPALPSCVTWRKLLFTSDPGFPHPWKLVGLL